MIAKPTATFFLTLPMLLLGECDARAQQHSAASGPSDLEFRTWTDSTGKHQTEAAMVELVDGEVHLERKDGRVVAVPVGKLSGADQRYVRR